MEQLPHLRAGLYHFDKGGSLRVKGGKSQTSYCARLPASLGSGAAYRFSTNFDPEKERGPPFPTSPAFDTTKLDPTLRQTGIEPLSRRIVMASKNFTLSQIVKHIGHLPLTVVRVAEIKGIGLNLIWSVIQLIDAANHHRGEAIVLIVLFTVRDLIRVYDEISHIVRDAWKFYLTATKDPQS